MTSLVAEWLDLAAPFIAKLCLVCLFPLSALDKLMHWDQAMKQARSSPIPAPAAMLVLGILVEVITPVLIVAGRWDRAAAFVLMGFCGVTAVLFHRWWEYPLLWSKQGEGKSHFWDFFKNFGLVGGLLLVVIAGRYAPVSTLTDHPFTSGPQSISRVTR
ncbi:DoxX family protein [Methylobacterium sp. J-088]|uniref:DoxX family protein n=1 Tax=Methylobacterium sp. J-088 TaxID=2836664 RepID=UPI001FBAF1CC|nr:DoxX family protein [Methylobacterium sp. J-088]MCJ2065404.1 DoxX family protein [Methylobacterium sp. J-088]